MIGGMDQRARALRESWAAMFAAVTELPGVPRFFADQLIGDGSPVRLLWIALGLVAIFAVGILAEQLYLLAVRDVRRQIYAAQPATAAARVGYSLLALLLDFIGIVVFALATIGAFFVLHQGHAPVRLTVMTWVGAVFAIRLVALVTCALLAPDARSLRILPVDDTTARFLYRRIMRIAIVWALVFPTIKLLQELGLDRDLVHLLTNLGIAVVVALLIDLIWQSREPVARAIRGAAPHDGARTAGTRVREIFARIWHIPAMLYVLVLWALTEVDLALGYPSRAGAALDEPPAGDRRAARRCRAARRRSSLRQLQSRRRGRCLRPRRDPRRTHPSRPLGDRALWLAVGHRSVRHGGRRARRAGGLDSGRSRSDLAGCLCRLGARQDRNRSPARTRAGRGRTVGGWRRGRRPGGVACQDVTAAVPQVSDGHARDDDGDGGAVLAWGRHRPLLAGAGVVGIAIGFGAQTLVRDIVSGVFFLLDDAFRLGEYIEVGEIRGTVENISIRSLRLRHHRGALHTVPFGEIQHLTNHSRDWVIMKLQFRVPYDTDLQKVKKIFKKIGAEMAADPVMGPNLLDPPKSQGVLEMDDSAMIIRAKFMAKPGEQFVIRRELYQRVQKEFEAAGIEFARRQVSVYVPPGTPPEQAAAAAAQRGPGGGVPPRPPPPTSFQPLPPPPLPPPPPPPPPPFCFSLARHAARTGRGPPRERLRSGAFIIQPPLSRKRPRRQPAAGYWAGLGNAALRLSRHIASRLVDHARWCGAQ